MKPVKAPFLYGDQVGLGKAKPDFELRNISREES
jgi:hypothetical protein